jgi:raffinose/stachyose/melibiose transport system permease protein
MNQNSERTYVRPIGTILVALLFLLPIFIVLINSVKESSQILGDPAGIPTHPTMENFANALNPEKSDLLAGMQRSIMVTIVSALLTCLLSGGLAYTLARSRTKSAKVFTGILLAGFMVPGQVLLVPLVEVLRRLHLLGNYTGLILANIGFFLPFGVFVFTRFIRGISRELDEAAAIDGASKSRTFWVIIFPLLRPATASVLIFLGVWIWNDFLAPLIILGPLTGQTVITGLFYQVSARQVSDYGTIFAYMILASLPILVFFLALQKQFISGLTAGATKG